jgi:exonuclease VII small subunit
MRKRFLMFAVTPAVLLAGVMTWKADSATETGYRVAEATIKRCPNGYFWDGRLCRRNTPRPNAPTYPHPTAPNNPPSPTAPNNPPSPTAPNNPPSPTAPNNPPSPTAPNNPPSPNKPTNVTTCVALKQTMDWLLGFEKLLSNSAVKLGQEISDADKVISSLQNQMTQLNQAISSLQQGISSLQQMQQQLNDDANVAQTVGQGGIASALWAAAQALGATISQLQIVENSLQLQVKALQIAVSTMQQQVVGLTESLNEIKGELVKLTGEWYTDNAIYNDKC